MPKDYQTILAICMKLKENVIYSTTLIVPNLFYQNLQILVQEVKHLINTLPNEFEIQKQFLISDCESCLNGNITNAYGMGMLVRDLDNLNFFINSQNQEQRKTLPENKRTCKKIFISHSSKDKDIADAFVTLLTRGGGLTQDDIFCTSIEGMKIKNGEDIRKHIQENVNYADFAILLVSNNYKKSEICLNEMGAVWAIDKEIRAYVFPDLREEQVGWLINNNVAEKLNDITALASLYEELQRNYNLPLSMTGWTAQAKAFCEKFRCSSDAG